MKKMTSGQIFEQRQIFKAPIRFSDQSGTKIRPIVIISHNQFNRASEDLICCPITSELRGWGRVINPQKDYEINNKTLPIPESEIKSQHPLIISKSILIPLKNRIKINRDLAKKIVEDINEVINPN